MKAPHFPQASDFLTRLGKLGIRPEELEERFARSSGPGGQNVNKVSTSVTLCHPASGISVTVQDSRSQAMNRQLARERLLEALEGKRRAEKAEKRDILEKTRRRNRPRPRGVKRRMVDSKKRRGAVKKLRGKVDG